LAGRGPRYLRVLQFLERAIANGQLRPGDRLPPQRHLAEQLGLDLTTVTRVYAEAAARHLIHARGTLGTFVSAPSVEMSPMLDLSMNIPPPPARIDMADLLRKSLAELLVQADTDKLMSYQSAGGGRAERAAGLRWLTPILGAVDPQRISVAPGAQAALASLMLTLTSPGEGVLTEPMTYPGLLGASRELARPLVVVDADEYGMRPDALARACESKRGHVVYLNPTMQNPTAATMPEHRRREIVAVARQYDLQIVEDDPYWLLADNPPLPIAHLAPERTHYITTLSKCLMPGLRTAYVVSPDERLQQRYLASLAATTLMPASLGLGVATQWIHDGTARQILQSIKSEARDRQQLAELVLMDGRQTWPRGAIHVWQNLPSDWTPGQLAMAARMEGLAVTPSDAFTVGATQASAIRISLGGIRDRQKLRLALQKLAGLLRNRPGTKGRVDV
jgi:DNA-binding transcriptional MocR family regulator